MTAIGVTNREGDYNRRTEAHDWPTEELLKLPFLQLDQVKDSLHAYQLSKRGELTARHGGSGALG
jgi:hypothetical protein